MASLKRLARMPHRGLFALLFVLCVGPPAMAGWSVTYRNGVTLSAGAVPGIRELSGVTYLGPAGGGLERFAAVQDDGSGLVRFDVALAADGSILSAVAANELSLQHLLFSDDYEGVAFTNAARNSVFVVEERTPDLGEYSLATGQRIGTVALPAVYDYVRSNLGLESLTRAPDGRTMWMANEEALSVDGPISNQSHGTYVRLLRMDDDGANVTVGPQFAYQVEPNHSSNPDKSGLTDLVVLPDDTLLTLERSRGNASSPANLSRIFEVDFTNATDVSGAPYATGLIGQSFTPAGKSLLFSGPVGTIAGVNMEGLALGPQLANGNWLLLGVADNGGSGSNPIMTFELSLTGCELTGDYNCDGAVGEEDYKLWRGTFGSTLATAADGNSNGVVDAADYTIWRDSLSETLGSGAAADSTSSDDHAIPEPGAASLLAIGIALAAGLLRRD